MIDYQAISAALQTHDRNVLIEIISNGINLPRPVVTVAYIQINNMPDEKIAMLCDKASKAIEFLAAGDLTGLNDYMQIEGIPPPLINVILGVIKTHENGN